MRSVYKTEAIEIGYYFFKDFSGWYGIRQCLLKPNEKGRQL